MKSFKSSLHFAGGMPWVLPRGAYQCQQLDSSPHCRSADTCLALFPLAQGREILGKHNPPLLSHQSGGGGTSVSENHRVTNPYSTYMLNLAELWQAYSGFSYFIPSNLRGLWECTTSKHALDLPCSKSAEEAITNVNHEGQVLEPQLCCKAVVYC